MSTGQNYSQVGEPTNIIEETVKTNGQTTAKPFAHTLQFEVSLHQGDDRSPSPAESLYLTFFDASHAKIEELEGTDQGDESEKFFAGIDQLHCLQDTQGDIVRALFARYADLSKAHAKLSGSSLSRDQLLQAKDEHIDSLKEQLDYFQKLCVAQADTIGRLRPKTTGENSEEARADA